MEIVNRLRARNLAATVTFWRDVLGFQLSGSDNPGGEPVTWCELRRDDAVVEFWVSGVGELPELRDAVGLCLRPSEVDAVLAQVPTDIVAWAPEDFDYGWREAGIRDPNGYLVILGSPSSARRHAPVARRHTAAS